MEPLRAPRLLDGRVNHPCTGHAMLDIVMLALGLGGFALLAAYVAACDRV